VTLAEVPARTAVMIHALALPPGERRRLTELGLRDGARIEVLRRAPFGGPLALRVGGALIALRLAQAAQVAVHPEPGDG
jgi:ferrous iron transport protein A